MARAASSPIWLLVADLEPRFLAEYRDANRVVLTDVGLYIGDNASGTEVVLASTEE